MGEVVQLAEHKKKKLEDLNRRLYCSVCGRKLMAGDRITWKQTEAPITGRVNLPPDATEIRHARCQPTPRTPLDGGAA